MRVIRTDIADAMVIEPVVYEDERGFFLESFNQREFDAAIGERVRFVQDNHSRSSHAVLRGLHYQVGHVQDKLVRVVSGEIYDVAVDLRRSSPTFGGWVGFRLSADNKRQLWIGKGLAHGFVVLSDYADVLYKTTDFYHANDERSIIWNDPDLSIDWPLESAPILSGRDRDAVSFQNAECFP